LVLILTRRAGESIKIGDEVTVTVLSVRNRQVKFGVAAPKDVPVHREEVYERIRASNLSLQTPRNGHAAEALGVAAGGMTGTPDRSTEDERVFALIATSGALSPVFRLCESLLQVRAARTFKSDEVLYEIGDTARTVFLILSGVVRTGTTTAQGREIVYHLRKDGDVVGELCVMEAVRRERAVAVEKTEAIPIGLEEFVNTLTEQPALLREVLTLLCGSLADAYDQVNRLADDGVLQGLIKVLRSLALTVGQPSGSLVEIDAYLTHDELSHMVGARRERVSTALNALRRGGLVRYSRRGRLLLDVRALEKLPEVGASLSMATR